MTEKEWFTDWFDSAYYHLLYNNRDEHEAEKFVEKLTVQLKLQEGAQILDVACGKGRHAKTLHKLGFNVTGIDLSENSIAAAKAFEDSNLHFVRWDMRETYCANCFDVAVNLFSSFGYLPSDEDNLVALKAIASNLKPQGVLILDYMNAEWVVKQLKPREILQRGDTQFHIQKKVQDGFILKKIQFVNAEGSNDEYEEKLRIIHLQTFRELCSSANLEIKNIWGDYELGNFNPGASPRIILHCQKQ
ncbi:MAG: class I SAM-dependent methyltransferase [Chitinophagales bacterium]|nr:class I SAM-dependent methyltransferase [Chitinophagales bacterium]